ncbi:MAG: hypothetical protein ACP5HC_09220 [Caldisericum sp.]
MVEKEVEYRKRLRILRVLFMTEEDKEKRKRYFNLLKIFSEKTGIDMKDHVYFDLVVPFCMQIELKLSDSELINDEEHKKFLEDAKKVIQKLKLREGDEKEFIRKVNKFFLMEIKDSISIKTRKVTCENCEKFFSCIRSIMEEKEAKPWLNVKKYFSEKAKSCVEYIPHEEAYSVEYWKNFCKELSKICEEVELELKEGFCEEVIDFAKQKCSLFMKKMKEREIII